MTRYHDWKNDPKSHIRSFEINGFKELYVSITCRDSKHDEIYTQARIQDATNAHKEKEGARGGVGK